MPIVWCAQQLVFEGSPASIARIIEHVKAVKYPTRDMGVSPHQQMASRIGAKEALLWRANRAARDDADTSDRGADSQEEQNQELPPQMHNDSGYYDGDDFFFDFQLSTAYPTYAPHLTRRVCFNANCHKIIGAKSLDNDSATYRSCCKLDVYCSDICLRDHEDEHESRCQGSAQHLNARSPNVKIEHFALTAEDKENNAAIRRTIRLCVNFLIKNGRESFKADDMGVDDRTAYHVLSKSCPYLMSHILSFVGIGEGGMNGRETCTSVTWLNHGGPAYNRAKIAALAKGYDCQIKYLHARCNILPGARPKAKLIVSASGKLMHESEGSLCTEDVEEGGEFRWVATNAMG
jgi:hypothetical protein